MKIKKNGKVIRLNESDIKRIVKRVLNEESYDRGIDFWLEELSEFAIHLENGYYDEYSSLGGYDIENIKDIIRQAREDKSLSDNDLTIVTEYGHDIHKDIIDIISSSGIK